MKSTQACSIGGCDKPVDRRGWCSMHYTRWKRNGDPLETVYGQPKPLCSVEGCERTFTARGLCNFHYKHLRNHGDPLKGKFVRSLKGKVCAVQGCERPMKTLEFCDVHYKRWMRHGDPTVMIYRPRGAGTVNEDGYYLITQGGRQRREHRKILEMDLGRPLLASEIVHHKDGNKLNNDPSNLEVMTRSQHARHHAELRKASGQAILSPPTE